MSMREIGRVVALWRYPVKSMAGESLTTADVGWNGLAGDRRWAFVRPDQTRNGFPWLTIRQRPDMLQFRPAFTDPARPDASPTIVRTPSGAELDIVDPALAAELGAGVHVIKQDRGIFDDMPLSLISTRSIAGLGAFLDADLDPRRFRPNLLVETCDDAPFPDDEWVGTVLQIGDARLRIDLRDKRCAVVGVDPVTAQSDPAILRAISRERAACLGVYGSIVRPGRIAVGDAVIMLPATGN